MRTKGAPLLLWLACLLPLLALLSSQLSMFCNEQGDCALPVQVGAWLLWPLVIAWLIVVTLIVFRGTQRLRRHLRRSR